MTLPHHPPFQPPFSLQRQELLMFCPPKRVRMDGDGAICWFPVLKHFWFLRLLRWGLPGIKSKEGNRKSLGATVLWLGGDQFDLTGIINYQGIIMKYFYSSKHFLCWLLNSKVLNCISFDEFSCMSSYDKEKVVFESRKYMSWSCIGFHTRFHSDSHHVGKYVHDSFCPQWAPAFSWPWPLWKEIAKRKILVCPMNL